MEVWPGRPFPLGATWDGEGTNFSLFSEHAERVELCLFDGDREARVELHDVTAHNWHCYLPGIGPGRRYGYRVHGPYDPASGHRFNPNKLLLDPYAKAIEGPVLWDLANVLPYVPSSAEDADLELDDEDDADAIPKCVVADPAFDWEDDRPPETPWTDTVIYEVHVKGFTKRHPEIRDDLRGTYAALASEPALAYFQELGVTAVELLPIHHIADESFLHDRGLSNYWGYSSIGYLAPHALYAATGTSGEQVREFKGMVKALHGAGIEVILDVVYNHTAEGNHLGPMLSFRGLDNRSYYRLMPDDLRYYMDFTGTGNSLNPVHPSVLRLIMDSLRYWVLECRVDGFRFDLASALAREFYDVDRLGAFFDTIHQDPVLSQVKLIAEPWDVGPGGYQVGNFPVLWAEWNGKYRDSVRDFWRGQGNVGEFAQRFTGSSDLYGEDGRTPFASINFVTVPRRLHAARPRLVQREAQRGEPRGQPRRQRRQPLVEPRRRGRDRRPGRARAAVAAAEELPRHAAPVAGRAHAARRRRARTDAGRQQQRVVPGQRDLVVRLGNGRRGATRVCAARDRAAERASGLPAHVVPHRQSRRERAARRVVVPARRAADDAARLDEPRDADARRLPQRPGDPRADAARRADLRGLVPAASSTCTPSRSCSRCRRDASARAGGSSSPPARRRPIRSARAPSSRSTPTP